MAIILNIETAVQHSSVCLAKNGAPLGLKTNPSQKDSAAWLHLAISSLFEENSLSLNDINAIAVSAGPGSYTGLRVGMATAKGMCYALQKPLITLNTLKIMAAAVKKPMDTLLCPMIDARRMEVFTAVFDQELNFISPTTNIILEEASFSSLLDQQQILFFGNGSQKFQSISKHQNALFANIEATAQSMMSLSFEMLNRQEFANLAYSNPFYAKDFHSSAKESL